MVARVRFAGMRFCHIHTGEPLVSTPSAMVVLKKDLYRIDVHPDMNNVYQSPGMTDQRANSVNLQCELTAFLFLSFETF